MIAPTSVPAIEVERLSIRYGSVAAVDTVSFAVSPGQQLTLLGPSGCGKTSTMRAVAGLEKPSSGVVRVGGRPMFDAATGTNVPAEQRGMSMVFQSYAIWPHMTVFDNVAYGLRVRKETGAALKEKVHHALDLVKMGQYANRNASALSGGQQQRVALARAVAFSPSVLLFDEPLSNLDAKLRSEMRIELRELQRRLGLTSIYVTHDLEEALAMSDRIVVMRSGVIEQIGTPTEIYNYPRSAFVADFVGSANLVKGRHRPDLSHDGQLAIDLGGGAIMHGVAAGRAIGPGPTFSVRTTHLRLTRERPGGDVNVWPVTLRRVVFQGDFTQAFVTLGAHELVLRSTQLEPIGEGQSAFLSVDPARCVLLEE
jgi:ABC-type Fe3+/spermidine/putrescine transport system ATPase subunit